MTRPRYDEHSTEFGLWLREQPEIKSDLGYITSNIDYVWRNFKTGEWMLIEEKRYGGDTTPPQNEIFYYLDAACKSDKNYRGFHRIVFTKTSPDDGEIILDGNKVTREQLIQFLMRLES